MMRRPASKAAPEAALDTALPAGAVLPVAGMIPHRRAIAIVLVIASLVVLPLVPGLSSDFGRSLLTQMAIATIFALSFNLLYGETGLLSFGHAVYFGLGAYAAIHAMRAINHGFPCPMALVPLIGAVGGF